MEWLDYREKLGIGFNDEKKAKYFFTLMFNLFDGILYDYDKQITAIEHFEFCNMTGISINPRLCADNCFRDIVSILRSSQPSIEEFLSYYCAFVNCQNNSDDKPLEKDTFIRMVCDNLKRARIQFELLQDGDGVFIFPRGVSEFDEHLVSEPLFWLDSYPNSEKAWGKALRAYSDSTEQNTSDVADLFRKALEAFFQEFFNSSKSLENYKADYGNYLKQKGVPKEIAGNLEALLQAYTNYMNNYAKHHDKTEKNVLEYLMYQTGNILRLLLTLKQADNTGEADGGQT